MPRFSGVKCEECTAQKIDSDALPVGYTDEWRELIVTNEGTTLVGLYLGKCDLNNSATLQTHYLCSPPCLFKHIARLLNIDPTELHREKP